jgi:hypothetical protein
MPSKKAKVRTRKSGRMAMVANFPGRYVANPIFRRKFRYQAQAAESKGQDYITMGSLQNLMYVGVSGTSGLAMFSSIRLKSVEVWADSSATNTLTTISLDWVSPDAPNAQVAATGNSFSPAHFKAIPPRECAASRWYAGQLLAQNTPTSIVATTPYAFTLAANAGAICEIDLEFTIFDSDGLNNAATIVSTGTSAGIIYTNTWLDNTSVSLGNGTKNWLIQGLVSINPSYVSAW